MDLTPQDLARRNSLPYPMELGSPAFAPVPILKEKDIILNTSKLHAKQEYDRIMEQVQVLQRQAEALIRRMEVSEMVHHCVFNFRPYPGRIYYVYWNGYKNEHNLSHTAPHSWSARPEFLEYRTTVRFMGDSSWEEVLDQNP